MDTFPEAEKIPPHLAGFFLARLLGERGLKVEISIVEAEWAIIAVVAGTAQNINGAEGVVERPGLVTQEDLYKVIEIGGVFLVKKGTGVCGI